MLFKKIKYCKLMKINKLLLPIFILIIFVFQWINLSAQDTNTTKFINANKAYVGGNYYEAIEIYNCIISSGFESSALYYNLGNAYFKVNNIPSSILFYEKALKLDPSNENAEFNLRVAQTKIIDKIDELPVPFYKRFFNFFTNLFPLSVVAIICILSFVVTLLCVVLFLISKSNFQRKLSFWVCVCFICITVFSNFIAYEQFDKLKTSDEAIIFESVVNVKSSPDEGSTDIFVIHEGTKVKILDYVGEWSEIKIANGSQGWIKASDMKGI